MGYEEPEITTAQILAAISDDGNKLNPLIAAEVLAAITDDDTRFSGADIAAILAACGAAAPLINFMVTQDDVGYNGRVGTWATGASPTSWVGRVLSNTTGVAQNDELSVGQFYVPASGDYTAYLLYIKDSDAGIAHAMVNDVDKGTEDMYNGSSLPNQLGNISLGTLTAGLYNFSIKAASKNGSSSNYILYINAAVVVKD